MKNASILNPGGYYLSGHRPMTMILSLKSIPLSGRRIRAVVDLSQEYEKSNLEFKLTDARQVMVSRTLILDNTEHHLEFALHLRDKEAEAPFVLSCTLQPQEQVDAEELQISIESLSE